MATIANLMVKIGSDVTGLIGGLEQSQSRIKKMASSFSDVGKGLTLGVSLPLAGIGAFALNAGMEFEQGMSNIKAVSGATAAEMTQLHDLALKMGKDTAFSARGAADGIEELIKAGLTVEQIMSGGLQGALDLAQAGSIDLASAAEVAATALNAFKSDALSVSKAADILAGAANASATDVMEMKLGLSQASAVASAVGMSFLDTSSALAVFAQNGLKGSDAGTSLKTMLLALQPQTKDQIALFKKLNLFTSNGTSAFFDQQGKLKNLTDIADTLRRSMSGMTDAQRLSTMETLFGTDAIRAANILYREGADGIQTMQANMADVTAQEVAAEKMNNLKGSLEELKGSVETAAIGLYETNQGPLKTFVDYLGSLVDSFITLDPQIQQFILIGGMIAASIGPTLMIIAGMASGINALGAAFKFIVSPTGLWILAIATVVAGLIYLWNTNEEFRAAVIEIWNSVQTAISTFWPWAQPILMAIGSFLLAVFQSIYNWTVTNWPIISSTIMGVFSTIWAYIQPIVSAIWSFLMEVFGEIFLWWQENWPLVAEAVSVAWNRIWTVISFVTQQIWAFLKPMLGAMWDWFKVVWTGVELVVKTVWAAIKLIVRTAIDLVLGIVKTTMQLITGDWEGAWNTIKETASKIIGNIWTFIKEIFNNGVTFFVTLTKRFYEFGSDLFNGLKNGIMDAGQRAIQAALDIANKVKDTVAGFFKIHSPSKVFFEMGGFISEGFAKGILDGSSYATKAANQMSTATMGGATSGIPSVTSSRAPTPSSDAGRPIIIYLGNELIYEGMDNYLGNNLVKLGGV